MLRFVLTTILLSALQVSLACTGGATSLGTMTPTVPYQTVSISNGDYFLVNVSCGNTYHFDFCGNGGSSGSLWAEISILNSTGATQYDFAPYVSGQCTQITWTATFTGTIRVLITDSGCSMSGSWSGTLAYNETSGGPLSPNFSLAATGCTSASATVTGTSGGTFTLLPPTGGASVDANTGALTGGNTGSTYSIEYSICGTTQTNSITLPPGNPAFSLNVECGGATANITGHSGGTFAFNPTPTDGAQVDANTGTVSNGTAGNSYTVEYTVCGVSSTQTITVLDDNCWTLNGNAQNITVAGEPCIQLTAEVNNQTGCAWNSSQIDFASDFTLTLDYYFGNNINGADGNTFTFQPSSSTACGQNGGQLGAGGLTNALSIEFDTYDNDNPTHLYDMACDHIAVEIDGNMMGPGAPYCGPVCAKPGGGNIDDGNVYTVDIAWNSATQQLDIYFNGVLRLSCNGDFVNTVFGGQSQVYWGATSATGGLNNQQYFCPSTIVILPVELASFTNYCEEDQEYIKWETISEERVDYFQLEYTYDGMFFFPAGIENAVGTSQSSTTYEMPVPNAEDNKQRFYRLKIVDENGDFEYTDVIASKTCSPTGELFQLIKTTEYGYQFEFSENVQLTVLNQLGSIITQSTSEFSQYNLNASNLADGVYIVTAISSDGKIESKKITVIH